MQTHVESRRRDLILDVGIVTPISEGLHITKNFSSTKTLRDVFDSHCRETDQDPSGALFKAIQTVEQTILETVSAKGGLAFSLEDAVDVGRHRAFDEACALVPASLLHDYLTNSLPSSAAVFAIRHTVAAQLGLNCALQYLLLGEAPAPDQHAFSNVNGRVSFSPGVKSLFVENAASSSTCSSSSSSSCTDGSSSLISLSRSDPLPFRLTRGISAALSPALIHGVTGVSMGCLFDAIVKNSHVVQVNIFQKKNLSWYINDFILLYFYSISYSGTPLCFVF